MLIPMTLTFIHGHSGLTEEHTAWNYIDNEASDKHARLKYLSHDLDFENIYMA